MAIRVWMIIDSLSQRGGGMELQAVTLGAALRRLEVETHYLARAGDFSHFPQAELPFIHTYPHLPGWLPRPLASMTFLLQNLWVLTQNRSNVNILHAHGLPNGLVARIGARLFRRPTLVKIASAGSQGEIAKDQRKAFFRQRLDAINHLSAIIATTPEVEQELRETGYRGDKIVRIPNGVDTHFFRPAEGAQRSPGVEGGVVVCVARFVPKKRHELLVAAWSQVIRRHPQARLVLVGAGPLRAQIEQQVQRLEVANSVTFSGDLDRPALRTQLQAADLFALPSVSEGLSNAMLEALACGVPVMTTETPGTRYIIQDQHSGVLLPEAVTPLELANAINTLLSDPARLSAMRQVARQNMESCFSIDKTARDYCRLYTRLLAEQGDDIDPARAVHN